MQIRIRYFASLREAAGVTEETLDLPGGATVAQARSLLTERRPSLAKLLPTCAAAVNRSYVQAEALLSEGAELAFIPPLGGG
ncbi:MAG TPA: molybdopterin converting factor subunit 1 [Ktedonobacterales bacterium]|jgi:molybdopterin synthase catalytic subunit|nr:molybdopterin converting factor subunit 1 [Ktedonobacterales bacterium]